MEKDAEEIFRLATLVFRSLYRGAISTSAYVNLPASAWPDVSTCSFRTSVFSSLLAEHVEMDGRSAT